RPGMFVNVDVLSRQTRPVLVIPATSVLYAPYGDSTFVLEEQRDGGGKPALIARQKFIRLGERRGDLVAATSGLTPGQPTGACAASAPRRSSAGRRRATASITPHRTASRTPRSSAPDCGSTATPRAHFRRLAPGWTRCAATCRPRPRSRFSTSSRPTASLHR